MDLVYVLVAMDGGRVDGVERERENAFFHFLFFAVLLHRSFQFHSPGVLHFSRFLTHFCSTDYSPVFTRQGWSRFDTSSTIRTLIIFLKGKADDAINMPSLTMFDFERQIYGQKQADFRVKNRGVVFVSCLSSRPAQRAITKVTRLSRILQ
jgi:hypothetical protein